MKLSEAYKAYASKLGITVQVLTQEEKIISVLDAVMLQTSQWLVETSSVEQKAVDGLSWNVRTYFCTACNHREPPATAGTACPWCHQKWNGWEGTRWDRSIVIEVIEAETKHSD